MNFFKKLFQKKIEQPKDNGIYLNVQCGKCKSVMRVRIDKQYDINNDEEGRVWRKTLVCDRCYQKMRTEIVFDQQFGIISQEINNGAYLSDAEVTALNEKAAQEQIEDQNSRGFG